MFSIPSPGWPAIPGLKKLLVAPFDLSKRLIALIERERDHALAGKPARIIAKLNSLVDQEIIEKLYEASCAGVKIDLIVRGICCLRPDIPGSERKHSRHQHRRPFSRAQPHLLFRKCRRSPSLYLSSADWMPRNFYRRVEIAFPIEDPVLRKESSTKFCRVS